MLVIKGDPHAPLQATIFFAISTLAYNRGNAKRVGRARAQWEVEFKTTRGMQTSEEHCGSYCGWAEPSEPLFVLLTDEWGAMMGPIVGLPIQSFPFLCPQHERYHSRGSNTVEGIKRCSTRTIKRSRNACETELQGARVVSSPVMIAFVSVVDGFGVQ